MERINVDQIIAEIKKEICESHLDAGFLPFEKVPFQDKMKEYSDDQDGIGKLLNSLEAESIVPYYFEMPSGPKAFVKKIIRKTVHCVFFPIMDAQNRFNTDVVKGFRISKQQEEKNYNILLGRIRRLEGENRRLKRDFYEIQKERGLVQDREVDSAGT